MIKTFPIYYPLYNEKDKFVFLITGGRGSGKSFAASTFLERLTFEMTPVEKIVHQILYTRYTMVSANISIIPEFLEKAELDGTERYFRSTRSDVTNRMTGSKVMFRGIKSSSGNQTAKLKSIHGITTFVVDEAEEWVSEKEFETIMLSIRQKGIQNRIVIIMNPTDNNHWVYRRFIENTHKEAVYDGVPVQISTHPNVLHIHTTYFDNIGHLSHEFINEVENMKKNDPEKYAHTVMGRWADVAEGAIYKNWGVVKEFPKWCKKVALGLDWGYTCFRGDTLITTLRGEVPIKDVRAGDYVLTRKGYHRVRKNIYNGIKKVVEKELVTDLRKSTFFATFEHNFNANGKWKKYGELIKKDMLYVLSNSMDTHTRDTHMGNIRTTITNRMGREVMKRKCCTMQFGSFITRKSFQRICAYTILTITHLITILATLCSLLAASIKGCILKNWKRFWRKGKISLGRTQKKIGKNEERRQSFVCNRIRKSVNGVEKSLLLLMYTRDFVQRNATTDGNTNPLQTMWRWSANIAGKHLWEINTSSPNAVQMNTHIDCCGLIDVRTKGEQWCDVYDLEIEGVHEYFANGFLVHNCDPTGIIMGGIVDNNLYLDEVCYKTQMTNKEIIDTLKHFGDMKVIADSADPRTINEVHMAGIRIHPVEKGAHSVIGGIEKMREYNIFVTERSYNLQKELRNYVWDKDKDGNYINQPADGQADHLCDASRYYLMGMIYGKIQKPKGDIAAAFAR